MADTGLTEITSETKILHKVVVYIQNDDENDLGMIKIWLMVITVIIYTKWLCIYNMNNDDGTEMIEI